MGHCLSVVELFRDMQRAQRQERSQVVVNVMIGRGPTFHVSTRQDEKKEKNKKRRERGRNESRPPLGRDGETDGTVLGCGGHHRFSMCDMKRRRVRAKVREQGDRVRREVERGITQGYRGL